MKRSKRLKNIMVLAEKKEKDAASALGFLQSKIESERQKKQQLKDYELEYHDKITEAGRSGISGSSLRRYYAFMSHLNDAATQQVEHIGELEQQVDQVQQYWLKTRGELKAFESLVERALKDERLQEDKQQQKLIDELSGLNYTRRLQSSGND